MLTMKELNSKIAGVRNSTAALRENIQTILVNAAGHAYQHGDVTAFTRLFDATSGMNRKQIARWAAKHGFAILQKDGAFRLNKAGKDAADFANGEAVVAYLTAEAPMWYAAEETAEDVVKQLDVASRIKSLVTQITNAAKTNTQVKINVVDVNEALNTLKAALVEVIDHRREQAAYEAERAAEAEARDIIERQALGLAAK